MVTNATSTTFVTLPIPSTTTTVPRPPTVDPQDPSVTADPDQPRGEVLYTIKAGDYLVRIARDFDTTAEAIAEYNGWPEGIRHALNPTDEIRIPPSDWDPDATIPGPGGETPGDTQAEGICDTYKIRAGDTKGRVANRFDITVEQLDAANADTPFYAGFVIGIDIDIPCP